ncbi:LysR family transcriptional regulator [Beijerinckia mobilis]|uniref:LysR family transcriptional regulator n=1 Tax=Beijerinckia mobilis TaxID=231434 RepID=UPI000690D8D9|nr:LysR family transcriptional regulator [Beijerinckia mobilis]
MSRWDGIDEFVAVAMTGSFARAAKALDVSTSHVSRVIARLESELQAQVFLRTTRAVTLTETGRALADQFQRIIHERDEAFAMVLGGGEPQGELRLTCSSAMGERFVAPIVRRYAQENPKLSVTIDLTNRVVDLVSEGYDLAIRTGQLADSRLIGSRIAYRRLYLCAAPTYLDRVGRPQTLADIADHECLIGTVSTWHFHVDGSDQVFRPKGRWRSNSGIAIVDAAVAGMGLCQLPEFYVLPHIASGALEVVLDDMRASDEPIWAVYPQRRFLLPKVRCLVARLRAELGPALNSCDEVEPDEDLALPPEVEA